jgi:hypothetical protein
MRNEILQRLQFAIPNARKSWQLIIFIFGLVTTFRNISKHTLTRERKIPLQSKVDENLQP